MLLTIVRPLCKWLFASLLCFTLPYVSICQYWAPVGATWYFEQADLFEFEYSNLVMYESIGDTIILGDTARILEEISKKINMSTGVESETVQEVFMKYQNDRVYCFDENLNQFRLLYDFNAEAGDTLMIYCRDAFDDSLIVTTVDSVSSMALGGDTLKVQHVSQPYPQDCWMSGRVIERIGCTGFMFPQNATADPPFGGALRCYEDAEIGLYHANPEVECDFITSTENIDNADQYLTLFPNPTTGAVSINSGKRVTSIRVRNAMGKTLLSNSNAQAINLGSLANGIYFVEVQLEDKLLTNRVVKLSY